MRFKVPNPGEALPFLLQSCANSEPSPLRTGSSGNGIPEVFSLVFIKAFMAGFERD